MGTNVYQQETHFHIKEQHLPAFEPLLDAIEAEGWNWVRRYNPQTHQQEGDITYVEFLGEDVTDAEYLFRQLAPVVSAGSYIEYVHDGDNQYTRWYFTGSEMLTQEGTVVYPVEPLKGPLSYEKLKDAAEKGEVISGVVAIRLNSIVQEDIEWFNDEICLQLVGHNNPWAGLLTDITWRVVGHQEKGIILLLASGNPSEIVRTVESEYTREREEEVE